MGVIPVLMVTHNRQAYSRKALDSIIHNSGASVEIMIWDNASTDGTRDWLQRVVGETGIQVEFHRKNVGLAPAMNAFFRRYADAPYVVKVDNDTELPKDWLVDLMQLMEHLQEHGNKMGAVSGVGWRPYGMKTQEWFDTMDRIAFKNHPVYFHSYIFGTGCLINMKLIRQKGLLFEKFPRNPEAGPDDPCLISGWTAYCREANEYEGWKFAMYGKVFMRLLNLKAEHVPSSDYPEYDREVAQIRDEGNRWWESVGGMPGVVRFVRAHGGYERLFPNEPDTSTPTNLLTGASDLYKRSTFQFWDERVKEVGTHRSTFLTTPQKRINEFTEVHLGILRNAIPGKDTLECGVGWGRMSHPIAQMAKSYVGIEFLPALLDKAKESLPRLDLRLADVRQLPFPDASFDVVVSLCCLSSWAAIFDDVLKEMQRVLRPNGRILFLEEDFCRTDWKLSG